MVSAYLSEGFARPRLVETVIWGRLLAGVLDGCDAVVFYGLTMGASPADIFHNIASGLLGAKAFGGGPYTVALDPTCAETVNATDYHVFLTPEGDCCGLYVTHKTPAGFEVHELGGGQSNVPFSYRIVALRRGYESVRMEDMTERLKEAQAKSRMPKGTGQPIPHRAPPALPASLNVASLGAAPNAR